MAHPAHSAEHVTGATSNAAPSSQFIHFFRAGTDLSLGSVSARRLRHCLGGQAEQPAKSAAGLPGAQPSEAAGMQTKLRK